MSATPTSAKPTSSQRVAESLWSHIQQAVAHAEALGRAEAHAEVAALRIQVREQEAEIRRLRSRLGYHVSALYVATDHDNTLRLQALAAAGDPEAVEWERGRGEAVGDDEYSGVPA